LASSRQYGNALLGVRHQEEEDSAYDGHLAHDKPSICGDSGGNTLSLVNITTTITGQHHQSLQARLSEVLTVHCHVMSPSVYFFK